MESNVSKGAASAYGWETGTNGPVDPIDPTSSAGLTPNDSGNGGPGEPVNPIGWDPTDINADITNFGDVQAGPGYVGEEF
jgi:hypothetical protein